MYMDVDATIRSLSREDAQTFIDVVNEARCTLIHRGSVYPTKPALTFRLSGTRYARSFAVGPKPVSKAAVQDVWSPRTSSKNDGDPYLLRPDR